MTEEPFSLPAGDGFSIHGRINRAAEPARRAVVLCHGLTGHMHEQQFHAAKRFFTARGYDAIRFNFYGDEDDARRILDCTVALHARDLAVVLDHFAPMYKRLYVAGHSYGGLAIMMGNPQNVAAASLWDSTFIPKDADKSWMDTWKYVPSLDEYLVMWQPVALVVGKMLYEEAVTFTRDRLSAWAAAFTRPAQVLAAGDFEWNLPHQRNLHATLGGEKEIQVVAGAGHGFNEGDTVLDLLQKTYEWFERH